jgi:hypothetical protein
MAATAMTMRSNVASIGDIAFLDGKFFLVSISITGGRFAEFYI